MRQVIGIAVLLFILCCATAEQVPASMAEYAKAYRELSRRIDEKQGQVSSAEQERLRKELFVNKPLANAPKDSTAHVVQSAAPAADPIASGAANSVAFDRANNPKPEKKRVIPTDAVY